MQKICEAMRRVLADCERMAEQASERPQNGSEKFDIGGEKSLVPPKGRGNGEALEEGSLKPFPRIRDMDFMLRLRVGQGDFQNTIRFCVASNTNTPHPVFPEEFAPADRVGGPALREMELIFLLDDDRPCADIAPLLAGMGIER